MSERATKERMHHIKHINMWFLEAILRSHTDFKGRSFQSPDGKNIIYFRFKSQNSQEGWGSKALNWLMWGQHICYAAWSQTTSGFKNISKILQSILKPTGSQWWEARIWVMWRHLLKPIRTRAVVFWTSWRRVTFHLYQKNKRKLE